MKGGEHFSVAVIGGGVAGLSIAWRLAQAGAATTLFEAAAGPAETGAATWASGGMLCARLEMSGASPPLAAFALSARAAWPAFAAELERASGLSCGFTERGALHVVFDAADARAAAPGIERIGRDAALALEPGLADDVTGALWAAGEAGADPRWLALALSHACRLAGVRIETGRAAERLVEAQGRVTGVVVDGAVRAFDHVVLAAGAWTGGLLAASNLPGPRVRPVKGEILSLAADRGAMPVRRIVWTDQVYISPHADGRLVIGATQREAGFDLSLDHDGIDALRRHAERAVPGIAALPELDRVAGFRPAADDGLPVLGGVGPAGLTLASGQFRNGILFAPLIADAAAQHALKGRLPAIARPFAAGRFAEAAA